MIITHELLVRILGDEAGYDAEAAAAIAAALLTLLEKRGQAQDAFGSARFLQGLSDACRLLSLAVDDLIDAERLLDQSSEGKTLQFSAEQREVILDTVRAGIDLGHARHHQHEHGHGHEHEHQHGDYDEDG